MRVLLYHLCQDQAGRGRDDEESADDVELGALQDSPHSLQVWVHILCIRAFAPGARGLSEGILPRLRFLQDLVKVV